MPFGPAPTRAAGDRGEGPLFTLLAFLVPSRCAGCDARRRDAGGGGLCGSCWARLDLPPPPSCDVCALPGPSPCAACANATPPRGFHRARAVGLYEGPLARAIGAFKFRGWDLFASAAAVRLAAAARRLDLEAVDALVPVPSTPRRNRERGFDPAVLLARETARRLRLPVRRLLTRRGETPAQSETPAARRAENVAGAFQGRPASRGLKLLLVDDVLTTGATASAAAWALRDAGAARVEVVVLSRTPAPVRPAPTENAHA